VKEKIGIYSFFLVNGPPLSCAEFDRILKSLQSLDTYLVGAKPS